MTAASTNAMELSPKSVAVSVVVPAYMTAEYLAQAVDSVLGQTFSNLELIIVNDGSPDTPQMEEILAAYLDLPQVRYLKQENRGPSAARNRGIQAARGEYVAFLDSDDFWAPSYLAAQMEALQSDPALDLFYTDTYLLVGDTLINKTFMDGSPSKGAVTFESLLREVCTVPTSGTVVRRSVVLQAGLFDESLIRCEDLDLWLRIAHRGARIGYQPKVLVYHRTCNGLAADVERMNEARLSVYRRLSLDLQLSPLQQDLLHTQIETYQAKLQLQRSKAYLLSGNYQAAFDALRSANAFLKKRKLQWGALAIRLVPGLSRFLYPRYQRVLGQARRHLVSRRAAADDRQNASVPGGKDNFQNIS